VTITVQGGNQGCSRIFSPWKPGWGDYRSFSDFGTCIFLNSPLNINGTLQVLVDLTALLIFSSIPVYSLWIMEIGVIHLQF
jgi:hypothetical protein